MADDKKPVRFTRLIDQNATIDTTFAGDTAIANVSAISPMWVVPTEEFTDVDTVEDMALRSAIFNSMYLLKPGDRRSLTKGKYNIIFGVHGKAFVAGSGTFRTSLPA